MASGEWLEPSRMSGGWETAEVVEFQTGQCKVGWAEWAGANGLR